MADINDLERTEKDYANLPPLVPKGEDRETVINQIVEAWCTPIPGSEERDEWEVGGVTLNRVALLDANTNEPVDLGELLRRVEDKLRAEGAPEEFQPRPDLHICLRGCRVDACDCAGLNIRPRFLCVGMRFGHAANFSRVIFGDEAIFFLATFGDGANFFRATFGGGASFDDAIFGDGARFWGTTFGNGASFEGAFFRDWAHFTYATFGDGAYFVEVSFGDAAKFAGATFGDAAKFVGDDFCNEASFVGATFGDGAHFRCTNFDDRASFDRATFGDGVSFDNATFGDGASFDRATFGDKANLLGAALKSASLSTVDGRGMRFDDATFGRAERRPKNRRVGLAWGMWHGVRRWIRWTRVRALGSCRY